MVLRYNNFWIVKKFYSNLQKEKKFIRDLKKMSYERSIYVLIF